MTPPRKDGNGFALCVTVQIAKKTAWDWVSRAGLRPVEMNVEHHLGIARPNSATGGASTGSANIGGVRMRRQPPGIS